MGFDKLSVNDVDKKWTYRSDKSIFLTLSERNRSRKAWKRESRDKVTYRTDKVPYRNLVGGTSSRVWWWPMTSYFRKIKITAKLITFEKMRYFWRTCIPYLKIYPPIRYLIGNDLIGMGVYLIGPIRSDLYGQNGEISENFFLKYTSKPITGGVCSQLLHKNTGKPLLITSQERGTF